MSTITRLFATRLFILGQIRKGNYGMTIRRRLRLDKQGVRRYRELVRSGFKPTEDELEVAAMGLKREESR